MRGVVADTSEWIEHLAGRPNPVFEQCLQSRSIIVPLITVPTLLSINTLLKASVGWALLRVSNATLLPLINVLELNLALDEKYPMKAPASPGQR